MKRLALSLAAIAALPAPVFADWNMNGVSVECYCTDKSGGRIEIGDFTCLHVDGRMFTAQCQMSLNVPMWREVSNGCVVSTLPQSKAAKS